jgi:hypothetical protein
MTQSRETEMAMPDIINKIAEELVVSRKENIDALSSLKEQVSNMTESIQTQTDTIKEQAAKPLEITDVNIPGLDGVETAIKDNTEAVSNNNTEAINLSDKLVDTQSTIRDGLDMRLEAMMDLDVNIRGLEGAVEQLLPKFEAVATDAARAVINNVLSQLAAAAGSAEEASRYDNVKL